MVKNFFQTNKSYDNSSGDLHYKKFFFKGTQVEDITEDENIDLCERIKSNSKYVDKYKIIFYLKISL